MFTIWGNCLGWASTPPTITAGGTVVLFEAARLLLEHTWERYFWQSVNRNSNQFAKQLAKGQIDYELDQVKTIN